MLRQLTFTFVLVSLILAGCGGKSGEKAKAKTPPTDGKKVAKKPADKKDTKNTPEQKQPRKPFPPPVLLDKKLVDDGWISLFDGVSLYGWKAENQADWKVVDGTITVSKGDQGLLRTTTAFGNYDLHLEFKSEKGTNSGIFLHTPGKPEDPKSDCYELNIADADNPFPTGSLVGRQKVAGNTDSLDWQIYDIQVKDNQLTVKLDGKQVIQYTDPKPLQRGYIGLQLNSGKVSFRNIRLKPLGLQSAFNGKDLSGWKTYPKMKSEFSVNDQGELQVKNGKGQLETEKSYADFVLQLQCKTNADGLNSGIFFRCIPGDEMMGYESQIHNGFKNNDRNQPVDHGTGGIFRRQEARRVVADDQQWFHKTLIADGPHVAAWVNGHQVSDWTDTRKPNENPRRGLRLAAGTIMIQGHDPTTDISFRGLLISEVAPRKQ